MQEATERTTETSPHPEEIIRIEFWNGQISHKKKYEKYGGLVTTKHNPCLWTNVAVEGKPWRSVYKKAIEYLSQWKLKKITDTQLLHSLRYVAYGYNNRGEDKRPFNNTDTIWPGNLTPKHNPKLVFQNGEERYTLYFKFENTQADDPTDQFWKINTVKEVEFYWEDLYKE
jgi:hypothetical protein